MNALFDNISVVEHWKYSSINKKEYTEILL